MDQAQLFQYVLIIPRVPANVERLGIRPRLHDTVLKIPPVYTMPFSFHRVRWGNLGLRGNLGLFAFSLLKR